MTSFGPDRVFGIRPPIRRHDLAARPIYHRKLESIEAHLTIVFTALAVARYIQQRTGLSIKKILDTLRLLKSALLNVGGQQITAPARTHHSCPGHHRRHPRRGWSLT